MLPRVYDLRLELSGTCSKERLGVATVSAYVS
jgi:hypothetical protein